MSSAKSPALAPPVPRVNYDAVDGVRSIAHISLIALHSAMLLTGKLPSQGKLWESFKSCLPFTIFQAGGIQVDVFFMLAGKFNYDNIAASFLHLCTSNS